MHCVQSCNDVSVFKFKHNNWTGFNLCQTKVDKKRHDPTTLIQLLNSD